MRLARIALLLFLVVPPFSSAEQSATDYINRGLAQHEQGDLDQAVALFRKAVELQPDFALAHNNLGNALSPSNKPLEQAADLTLTLVTLFWKTTSRILDASDASVSDATRVCALLADPSGGQTRSARLFGFPLSVFKV